MLIRGCARLMQVYVQKSTRTTLPCRSAAVLLSNNTFIVYENAAHGLFVTHADRLTTDLLAFMQDGVTAARDGKRSPEQDTLAAAATAAPSLGLENRGAYFSLIINS